MSLWLSTSPLKNTMILEPLDTEMRNVNKMYKDIQKRMNTEKDGFDCTYEQFLEEVLK